MKTNGRLSHCCKTFVKYLKQIKITFITVKKNHHKHPRPSSSLLHKVAFYIIITAVLNIITIIMTITIMVIIIPMLIMTITMVILAVVVCQPAFLAETSCKKQLRQCYCRYTYPYFSIIICIYICFSVCFLFVTVLMYSYLCWYLYLYLYLCNTHKKSLAMLVTDTSYLSKPSQLLVV